MMQAQFQNPGMQMPHGPMMGGPGPGHPMQQGMQMHPGVSGPGGPVSQPGPMMAGMQPGVGPNAHALSHLQPQQAHMFAQQQQQHPGMMNPALMQQQNAQRQALLRQQQHQQMLAQQNGMGGMGFPPQMANLNPQQIAALQQQNMGQPFVNLPPHLRQQMQQQQAMQQQQQQQQAATSNPQQAAAIAQAQQHAAQQAQAQAHAQAHAQQQQAQQQQMQQQQQQAIVMQHAQSQQSNHSQNGNQGPPTTTQPPQGPLRPPSAMSHQGQASPAPQPTPQQPPQSGPQPPQQTPAPNQPPNMQQQPSQQGQNQQQQPQQQQQMQQRNPAMNPQQAQAQVQAQAQAHAQAQAQAQANAARMAMMRQSQQPKGQSTLKLLNFVDQLGRFNSSRGPDINQISHWQAFVDKFFTESGSFIHVVWSATSERTKLFEIVFAAMPRYFLTLFNTEVENLQITLDGSAENAIGTESKVTCERARFIYTYKNQCQVVCKGKLTAFWAGSEKMEWLQFEMEGHQQYIPRNLIEPLFVEPDINQLSTQQSPRMSKTAKQKQQQQKMAAEPAMPVSKLPAAGITDWGLPPALQSYLEIYETMNHMTSLMAHYLENENLTPTRAMDHWNQTMASNNPAMQQNAARMQGGNMPPNQGMQQPPQPGMPPGARTPSGMGQPGMPPNQQFMSPAMQHSLLPNGNMNSPHLMQQSHTPSPASHPMVAQHSQSSATASQNTSPSINNKRRRSTAKIDADDGGGDMNGATKVKPSPRIGGNKRIKGAN